MVPIHHLLLTTLPALALATPSDPKVSLQWAICDPSTSTVLPKLSLPPSTPPYKSNPITYYDAWPPHYTRAGLAFRTKVKKHDPGYPISVIKARFDAFNEDVPGEAVCVWDRYGNGTTYTCGLSAVLAEVGGGGEGESVWSSEQKAFARRYQDVVWEDLVPFGPYENPKWKVRVLGRKAVFDDVQAAGMHLMEIELSAARSEAEGVYEEVTAFLRERGVVLCEKQVPKTLKLLDHLEEEAGRTTASEGSDQFVISL